MSGRSGCVFWGEKERDGGGGGRAEVRGGCRGMAGGGEVSLDGQKSTFTTTKPALVCILYVLTKSPPRFMPAFNPDIDIRSHLPALHSYLHMWVNAPIHNPRIS